MYSVHSPNLFWAPLTLMCMCVQYLWWLFCFLCVIIAAKVPGPSIITIDPCNVATRATVKRGVISLDGLPLLSRYCYMRVRWRYDIILYSHIDVYMSLVSIVIVPQEMDLERQRNWNMKWGNWMIAMLYNSTITYRSSQM